MNRRLSVLLLACFPVGCVYTGVERLPFYDKALVQPAPAKTKLIYEELVDWSSLPLLIPFAIDRATYDSWTGREEIAQRYWKHGIKEKADVVRVSIPERKPNGLIISNALFCRVAPCDPGFRVDSTGTIISINRSSNARQNGLLEGDKLVSIDGVSLETCVDAMNPACFQYQMKLHSLKPGDEITLVCVRSGTGRLETKVKCLENPPTHLDVADSIPWEPDSPEPTDQQSAAGSRPRR